MLQKVETCSGAECRASNDLMKNQTQLMECFHLNPRWGYGSYVGIDQADCIINHPFTIANGLSRADQCKYGQGPEVDKIESQLTIASLYRDHPAYLKAQLRFLTSLNKQTRDKFRVLLIDDASHPQLRADKFVDTQDLALLSMRIYRISPRRIFNIGGARNLVFTLAQGSVICLDIDILMDQVFLDELINMAYDLGGGTSTN